jgi:hypothetical protein
VEDPEGSKKLGEIQGGELPNSVHQERYDTDGKRRGCEPKKTAGGKEETGDRTRRNSQLDYTKRKSGQPPEKTVSRGQGVSNELTCMYTNVDTFINKKHEYETRVHTLNPDIIGVTEINPKNASWSITQQDLSIEGYNLYVNFTGRGSALYIKSNLGSTELIVKNCGEATVWCTVRLKKNDMLTIGVVYRSPNSTQQQNEQLEKMVEEITSNNSSHLLIMGDFNYPEIDWETQSTNKPDDHAASRFLTCVQEGFLFQHVNEPTHFRALQKANILDLVMTNEEGMVGDIVQTEPIGKSHHTVLNWKVKCYTEQLKSKVIKYCYDKGNFDEIRRNLAAVDWKTKLNNQSVEQMWAHILVKN